MRAMILAAGLGTRLRPLTDTRPKALVEIAGRTLLEITLTRLRAFGITEVIINVHHFADLVIDYLKSNKNFGMRIDRKSTRLNSSHLVISYAVFCLKKKKKHKIYTLTQKHYNKRYSTARHQRHTL